MLYIITLRGFAGAWPNALSRATARVPCKLCDGERADVALKACQDAKVFSANEGSKEEHRLASAYHAAC